MGVTKLESAYHVRYLDTLPASVPVGLVVVHNHVRPTRRLGNRGFRAWFARPHNHRIQVCDCGWAPELSQHFRVLRAFACCVRLK